MSASMRFTKGVLVVGDRRPDDVPDEGAIEVALSGRGAVLDQLVEGDVPLLQHTADHVSR